MDINILKIYRIFAIIGLILIVKQIVFLCTKTKNVTYYGIPFWLFAFIFTLESFLFILVDLQGKPNGIDSITPQSNVYILLLIFLFIQVCSTLLLYLFSGKYAEHHIVYNEKKGRKKATVNIEESYIILYGLLKFINKKVYVRDISVDESCYITTSLKSKLFPYAAVLGSNNYMLIRLVNGKTIKISDFSVFLLGDTFALLQFTKALGIKISSKSS